MRRTNPAGVWLGLACLLSIVATGCQGIHPRVTSKSLDSASAIKGDAVSDKTQFRGDLGANQKVSVHMDLARAFETEGKFEAAVIEYQKALDASEAPDARRGEYKVTAKQQALAQRRMGGALDRLGRFGQAEVHYRTALRLSPNDASVWNDAGYSFYLQSRWADAERALLTAAKIDPENPRVQTNLGLTLAAEGKTDAALAALSKASGTAVAHANLGYILASTGKTEAAREHYQAALQIQPQFEAARVALARLDAVQISQPSAAAGVNLISGSAGVPTSAASSVAAAPPAPPAEVVASERIVLGTPTVAPVPVAEPTAPVAAPIVVPAPVAVGQPAPLAQPGLSSLPPPAPRPSLAPPAIRPRPALADTQPIASRPTWTPPPVRRIEDVAPAPVADETVPGVVGEARAAGAVADAVLDPVLASASTGIPLPIRRAAARSNVAESNITRASIHSGIPLPSRPAAALDSPHP